VTALENRYLAPVLVTCVLLAAQLSFGILEGYGRTAAAILSALGCEILLARLFYRKWPHLASAYITGISVGMIVRSPLTWPFVLGSLLSITSKYVLRLAGRHLWNPSNFGVCVLLFLAADAVSALSVQWGNVVWPMVAIWILGGVVLWRLGRLHISATYVVAFILCSSVRSVATGTPWLAAVAPVTGPMYQLFIFFMITDPRTTVRRKRAQDATAVAVALVEMVLRLNDVVHAPLYALFIVGPSAVLLDMRSESRREHEL
jgi:enediyne biosynthesis protein E5